MTVAACETAYAKINLALHVRRRREDGYHEIETVFAFCDDGDLVTATPANALSLEINGTFAEGLSATDNLVLNAARCFDLPVSLVLLKNLPVASGIGGGSADAAATLRLLSRLTGEPLPPVEKQRALGADVPACVVSEARRGTGVGEVLESIAPVTGMSVLLVNPRIALSTAAVFRAWDAIDRGPLDDWRNGRNDLEGPAKALVPAIAGLVDWLRERDGALLARMSGSGATCFALFPEPSDCLQAAAAARQAFPGYWVMESRLR